jgi:ATP-dependent DNA helicase Rep
LPHRESIAHGNVDEERRLFYVGITRAERSLHLSFCRKRRRAGETIECQPSRFLAELAQDDLRWSGEPLPPEEAAKEKSTGQERLKAMKAMLAAKAGTVTPAGGVAGIDESVLPADNQNAPI